MTSPFFFPGYSSLPSLPGWGDQLAQVLPQLGNNLARIANPQIDQQRALKEAIINNPDVLNKIAAIERQNPGTLRSMGFGNLADVIGSVQPNPVEKATEDFAKQNPDKVARARLGVPQAGTEAETAASTRNLTANANRTEQLTGPEVQEAGARAQLTQAQAQIEDLKKQATEMEVQKNRQNFQDFQNIVRKVPDLAKVDMSNLATKVAHGLPLDSTEQAQLARLQSDQNFGPAFQHVVEGIQKNAQLIIGQNRVDLLAKSTRGEQFGILRLAMADQKDAENTLFKYQALKAKYGNLNKDAIMARMLASTDPNEKDELSQYEAMQEDNGQALKDAQDRAIKARRFVDAVKKTNPDIAKAMAQADSEDNTGTPSPSNKSGTTNTNTKPDSLGNSSTALDPMVLQARDALKQLKSRYGDAEGLKRLQSKPAWKALKPAQQQAVLQ